MKRSEKKEIKRRVLISVFCAIIVIAICIGSSYAYIRITATNDEEQQVNAGCLKLSLTEKNAINLTDSFPMSDASGMNTTPYTFSITNTCTLKAKYILSLNLINDTDVEDAKNVKIAIDGDLNFEPRLLSEYTNNILNDKPSNVVKSYYLTTSSLEVGETNTYDLRMWIDLNATNLKDFEAKIMAEATVNED